MTNAFRTTGFHRTLSTAAAACLLGVAAPLSPAHAAGTIGTITPTHPAAGSAFTVTLTGLTDSKNYRLLLTGPSTSDATNVAEANTCADAAMPAKDKTEMTCTITENTAGDYDLKLYEDGARLANQALTVGKAAAPTAPVATDLADTANDAVTVTYHPSIVWKVDGTAVTWAQGDKTPEGTKQDVKKTGDVTVTAEAASGYAFPAGATTSWTFRLTSGDPAASVLPTPAAPVATDQVGVDKDALTFRNVTDVTWHYSTDGGKNWTAVTFGAGETSKTITVTPAAAQEYRVLTRATAAAGKAFANHQASVEATAAFTNAAAPVAEKRVAGPNRVETAVEVSKAYFDRSADTVYVANALNYPDALTAGPAAARDKAPLLLTMPTGLSDSAVAEIKRLSPNTIKIVGGPSVVSADVEAALKQLAGTVVRYQGDNRYGTAAAIAGQWTETGKTVYLAFGRNFPDALSGGSGAAKEQAPLLLSENTTLTGPTVETLGRLNPSRVILVGGTGVLSSDLVALVKQAAPAATVDRYAGANRFGTSAVVIDKVTGLKAVADDPKTTETNEAKAGSTVAFVATGLNFPDALAGIPAAAKVNAPLGLSLPTCLPLPVKGQFDQLSLTEVVRLGGPNVLADYGNTGCAS